MLCYWHYSICHILFNREALLRDNTIVTRYRRQVAQLLIALIVSFFVLILPHKIWALIQPQLSIERFIQLGFQRHSFLIITTRSLLYLNSAVSPIESFGRTSIFQKISIGGEQSISNHLAVQRERLAPCRFKCTRRRRSERTKRTKRSERRFICTRLAT